MPHRHVSRESKEGRAATPRSGFVQLVLAADAARFAAASQVRYHRVSRAAPLKRGSVSQQSRERRGLTKERSMKLNRRVADAFDGLDPVKL